MTDNEKAFLKDLTDLTKKHGVKIGGCGCCGSPFIWEDSKVNGSYGCSENGDEVEWVADREHP